MRNLLKLQRPKVTAAPLSEEAILAFSPEVSYLPTVLIPIDIVATGQMQKAFEDATYATEVGQISGIVDSDSGIHIILRLA